jgi:hypothetical protein
MVNTLKLMSLLVETDGIGREGGRNCSRPQAQEADS